MVGVAIISSGLVKLPPTHGGAVEIYVYQLVKHLNKLGVQAIAIDFSSNKNTGYDEVDHIPIFRVPVPKLKCMPKKRIMREYIFGIRASKTLRSLNVDVIHANTAWAGFALAFKLRNKPLVYTCHNGLWLEERVHASEHVVRLIEGYTMRRSRAIIALNETMKRSIVEKAGVDPCKVFIVPNGVDTEFFKPGVYADDIMRKYGLEGKRTILFVGRVTYVKGVHLLLKAFSKLVPKYRDLKLVIAGPLADHFGGAKPSPYARTLMKYAEKKLPRNSYVFTDSVDRQTLRKLYSIAYVCVLPSYAEAFGMVLLEAMSSGCPVIGSEVGGIVNVIENGANGFTFRKGDVKDLERKLNTILDGCIRTKIGREARKIIEKYSWRLIASKLKSLYQKLCEVK